MTFSGTPTLPDDPLLPEQWHLRLIGDVEAIWAEFDGTGVHVGVVDAGVESGHADLAANYDFSRRLVLDGVVRDGEPTGGSPHGTAAAGLIAAVCDNGIGGAGLAHGAAITGINIFAPEVVEKGAMTAALAWGSHFDIVSNSWGYAPLFGSSQNVNVPGSVGARISETYAGLAAQGRAGLGTIIVHAAGNQSSNANGDAIGACRQVVVVAATDETGAVAQFSNHGASILVAAPAADVTTDLSGDAGFGPGDYTREFGGTSAAAPLVSAAVALMLQAAPSLGWRDVQDILAASARHTGAGYGEAPAGREIGRWTLLREGDWNGGGQAVHQSYGYGMLDVHGAVRMAEAWVAMTGAPGTSGNEARLESLYAGPAVALSGGTRTTILHDVSADIRIESVEVKVTIGAGEHNDLVLSLLSPDGDRIMLMHSESALPDRDITWTFLVQHLRGVSSAGQWTLEVRDLDGTTPAGALLHSALVFHGSAALRNDVYHFTDDFLALRAIDTSRGTITDADGGSDWLNLTALHGDVDLSLTAGTLAVDGVTWATLTTAKASFENAYAGDGNDRLTGNGLDNRLVGGRGNDSLAGGFGKDRIDGGAGNDRLMGGRLDDVLSGGDGADVLVGGLGADVLRGGAGSDRFVFRSGDGTDRILDFRSGQDVLRIDDALWGGHLTAGEMVARFGTYTAGHLVLDFGEETLDITGLRSLADLSDDLVLF